MIEPPPLHFDAPPSMVWNMVRIALRGSARSTRVELPALSATLAPQVPEADRLAAYRAICQTELRDTLPLAYPQLAAAALHLALLADKRCPIGGLGLLHVRNEITRHRALPASQAWSYSARLASWTPVSRGHELTIETEVSDALGVAWRATTVALARGPSKKSTADRVETRPARALDEASKAVDSHPADSRAVWALAEDTGRRFARIAGDRNPIHLWALTARPFGFPSAIVHGMYSLGRVLGALEAAGLPERVTVSAAFIRPVLLPSEVVFERRTGGEGQVDFTISSLDGARLHVSGSATGRLSA